MPGETARLQVRAPFAGSGAADGGDRPRARGARGDAGQEHRRNRSARGARADAPNAYCTLTLIRPAQAEAVWSAHRAIGRHRAAGGPARPRPAGGASTRPPWRVRRRSCPATVTVRDEDGKPAQGAVTVMAVDEAICMLTAFETPDPAKIFAAQRALGVDAYDLYAELMPVTEEQVEGAPAPGGDGEDGLRRAAESHQGQPVQAGGAVAGGAAAGYQRPGGSSRWICPSSAGNCGSWRWPTTRRRPDRPRRR